MKSKLLSDLLIYSARFDTNGQRGVGRPLQVDITQRKIGTTPFLTAVSSAAHTLPASTGAFIVTPLRWVFAF
jgi:hypothetical protein